MEHRKLWNGYDKEDKILISHVLDIYEKFERTGCSQSTFFLNPRELSLVTNFLSFKNICYSVFKASPECENSVLVFGDNLLPITIYQGTFQGSISHSDVLGTLFSIGYERNMIGDIFIEDESFYLTNLTRLNSFLEDHLYKIKNQVICLKAVDSLELKKKRYLEFSLVVSSYRLDHFVSLLSKTSRKNGLELIQNKEVILNYKEVRDGSISLKSGDVLSIKHVGKFLIKEKINSTRKGKMVVEVWKYQ